MPKLSLILLFAATTFAYTLPSRAVSELPPDLTNPSTAETNWTQVLVCPVESPRTFQGNDHRYNLVYDLIVSNYNRQPSKITKFEFLDGNNPTRTILSLSGKELDDVFTSIDGSKGAQISGGGTAVIWANLSFDKQADLPTKLLHRVSFDTPFIDGKTTSFSSVVAPLSVDKAPPVAIGHPLKGRWLVLGGYSSPLGHRRALFPIDGKLVSAQTFAIDWIRLNKDNYVTVGDRTKNESSLSYNQPVLAVSDGTISGIVNQYDDQKPDQPTGADRYYRPAGNSIELNMGNGYYAMYAHLLRNSMKVKEGEHVKKGQIIAMTGNSGNTTGPHLHLHITKGPSILGSPGVPYVFEAFDQAGMIEVDSDQMEALDKEGKPEPVSHSALDGIHHKELPKEGTVVAFPE